MNEFYFGKELKILKRIIKGTAKEPTLTEINSTSALNDILEH